MCFDFINFVWNIFFILRRIQLDMMKIHVKYPLLFFDFHETLILSTDFRKILKYRILWKSVEW